MMLKNIPKTYFIIVAAILIVIAGYFVLTKNQSKVVEQTNYPTPQQTENSTSSTPTSTSAEQKLPAQSDWKSVFNLDKKVAGTKLYYSDKLGVGFTYVQSASGTSAVTVTEIGSKIYLHHTNEAPDTGQSIEIFAKDPKSTLEEALTTRFLSGYNSKDCFSQPYAKTSLPNYVASGIASPMSDDPSDPSKNSVKCPAYYSDSSAAQFTQFFLMNKDVPDTFIFVRIGRTSITSDGTTGAEYSWSHSIRILK
jgi:hypothetical protein